MNILGIDTSSKKANVCIKTNNITLDKWIENEITHSEKLLPLIDNTFKEANITINDIDYLACTTGPGSFTGIRIGLSTIKAFAKVINKPIFAISSMDVLAYTHNEDTSNFCISVIDAKNSRIYYSVYKTDKILINNRSITFLERISDYANDTIDIALDNISNVLQNNNLSQNSSIKIIGDCLSIYEDILNNKFKNSCQQIHMYEEGISGLALVEMLENYRYLDYFEDFKKDYLTLDALYVRPSQAERAKSNEV